MKTATILLTSVLALGLASPLEGKTTAKTVETNNDVILHAWCWSFNTIRENIPDIAKAGYTIVQTSPAQECVTQTKGDKGGGNQLYGHGRWYYQYQPVDWKIGNYQIGTRDDLIALCKEANKYGIRIIVDVLPNHTSIDDTRVSDALDAAVGGHENLYHASGFTEITDYNDRLQCTTGQMGGLPDVNTENPDFQAYYLQYVNDLIKCGVRGFRYDTAKHIGLPSDPRDSKSPKNNFWAVATGRESANGVTLALPEDSLFIYGEVLQDKNVKEDEYAEYLRMCASGLGWVLRDDIQNANWTKGDVTSYNHTVDPKKLITWVESHDTYCNEHASAWMTDQQVRLGWVFLTARAQGAPLFYDRPDGSDGPNGNYWGKNVVGARGEDAFMHPLVAAVNQFRHQMQGQPESINYSANGAVAQVCRGSKGAAIVNLSSEAQQLSLATNLPNGKYKDALTGKVFSVKKGILHGQMDAQSAYILVK